MFRHALDVAEALGTAKMRIFSFFIPQGEDPARYRGEVLSRMEAILEAAEGRGIALCHENEKDIYGDTPERCLDLVKSLGADRLSLIFDFANFVQVGAETYPSGYRLLRPYIDYIHVKDALYRDGTVVPPGQGDGKLREIFRELDGSGFEGYVSIEPHLASFAGFEKLGDKITKPLPAADEAKSFAVAVTAFRELLFEVTGKKV
jgi:sugar phosphate isomerase/epimerase